MAKNTWVIIAALVVAAAMVLFQVIELVALS